MPENKTRLNLLEVELQKHAFEKADLLIEQGISKVDKRFGSGLLSEVLSNLDKVDYIERDSNCENAVELMKRGCRPTEVDFNNNKFGFATVVILKYGRESLRKFQAAGEGHKSFLRLTNVFLKEGISLKR